MTISRRIAASVFGAALPALLLAVACTRQPQQTTPGQGPGSATTLTPTSPESGVPSGTPPAETTGSPETSAALSGVPLGRMIFDTGRDPSGPVKFTGGPAGAKGACAACHGAGGRGLGGSGKDRAPEITWPHLQQEGYDQAKAARAVTDGLDDEGKPLDSGMPRYTLPPEDLSGLVDYLQTLR